uniref:Uncharacterized protein n=1 Tax=Mycena chlorophos TaxID=658473 RepID=A0ABQ0LSM7_MYCCL|nr:predicted protein [Mycena chlorophos]
MAASNTTTLPSFVELMATLGLDQTQDRSPASSPSSSPRVLSVAPPSPSKSRSSPSLRDAAAGRNRLARYSPYSPQLSERRGSVSSSSSSDYERPMTRAYSTSPHPPSSPRARRRHGNKLTVNVFGSNTDLAMPISSYVRRKTPGASPTSPTFPREPQDSSPSGSPMPFSIPTLPALFPRSASTESDFPLTPNSDIDQPPSRNPSPSPTNKLVLPDEERTYLHRHYHTGVRISSPPSEGLYPRVYVAQS